MISKRTKTKTRKMKRKMRQSPSMKRTIWTKTTSMKRKTRTSRRMRRNSGGFQALSAFRYRLLTRAALSYNFAEMPQGNGLAVSRYEAHDFYCAPREVDPRY